MKAVRTIVVWCSLCLTAPAWAQESGSVFNFLKLPTSAHTTALGGKNISLIEDDPSLTFQNPALLASVSDNSLNLNFMTYLRGAKTGSAAFSRVAGKRGTWGTGVQFVGYGAMKETLATGEELGDARALDMGLSGMYSYSLSDHWVGGATGKFIYSRYADYTSVGLAVDLGLNYYDDEHDFSLSAVAANLGGQVKAFGDKHERLPFDLQVGFSKSLGHAPIRFSLTLVDLTRWNGKYYYHVSKEPKGSSILMNHFCFGVDIIPTQQFYIAAGYNFRRAYEMKAAGSSHAAGLSVGAGLNIKGFKFGLAYAKYHVSSPTLSVSASYSL
ncbi:MAG: type IX secretion system protein PorQ [Bacteroidaceae bacterium]|nr:type IX secretion system protein PorQ [Bacteroidaceae bacterium]